MKMLNVGVIGPGMIWEKVHMPILEKLDEFHIMALCVHREEKKAYWQKRCPSVTVYTDVDEFLKQSNMDAVIITTPLNLNAPVTLKAQRAGKLVFVEKPLATTKEGIEAITDEEKKNGKPVYVLEQFLYNPQVAVILDIIKSEKLGKIVSYENVTYYLMDENAPSTIGYEQAGWRQESAFPLGHIWDGGVHQVALFNALFGVPKKIFAKGLSLREGMGKYNYILAALDYGNNFVASFAHSAFLGGNGNLFNVHFTNGSLYISANGLVLENKVTCKRETINIPEGDLYEKMWKELAILSAKDVTPPFTSRDAGDCVKFFTAMEKSIETGAEVFVGQ
jgi:predicted dehydrogenase